MHRRMVFALQIFGTIGTVIAIISYIDSRKVKKMQEELTALQLQMTKNKAMADDAAQKAAFSKTAYT